MAKLSRQTKEIIKTVLVVCAIAALVAVYIVYPLNRSKATMARANIDEFNEDSLSINDPTAYAEAGLVADTFRVESDGLTTLACLYIPTLVDSTVEAKGTVILIHDDLATRDSLIDLAAALHDLGFVVITYDQRACGASTGKYYGVGYYEASDVQAIISYLEIRGQVQHPLYLVGYGMGADAALLSVFEEERIDGLVAAKPYLTTQRQQDILKEQYQTYWFPFYRTVMWWWYTIRSSYAPVYTTLENIQPVRRRTLLLIAEGRMSDAEVARIKEISPTELLELQPLASDKAANYQKITTFLTQQ